MVITMDNTNLFDNKSDNYVSARPSYAPALFDKLCEYGLNSEKIVADIGCGTGIFTRQLLENGATVYGVELNDEMREKAENALSNYDKFISVNASAEATTLPDNSIDFITCAQSFHWFDKPEFKLEAKRILKQNGVVALIWNMRDTSDKSTIDLANLTAKHCENFKGFNGGTRITKEEINIFFDGKYDYFEFDNPLDYDLDKFIKRSLSSSYAPAETDSSYTSYVADLKSFFAKYSQNNIYIIPNKSALYVGRV